MNFWKSLLVPIVLLGSVAHAQVKISQLPAGSAVDSSTAIAAVQGGITVQVAPSAPWFFEFPAAGGQSSLVVRSTNPIFEFNRTSSAANNRRWRMFAGATNYQMGPCADDGTTCSVAMQVLRSASTVTDIDLLATNVRVNSSPICTQNGVGCPTGTTLASGTYTPTAGQGAASPRLASYTRVGNVVQVAGSVVYSSTGNSIVTLTLPIASSLTTTTQLNGTVGVVGNSPSYSVGGVSANTVDNRAALNFTTTEAATLYYTYQYTVQ